MAAPTLESTQTTTWATSGSTVVITKPTSLAVGDLMICRIVTSDGLTISNFAGFTSIGSQITGSPGAYESFLGYKIADSGDVAASTFTITLSNSGSIKMGSISRISNPDTLATNYKYSSNSAANTISPSFTGVTPTNHADGNLIMQFWTTEDGSGGSPTIGSYSVATSNPSWTEVYELSSTVGNDVSASMAWAARPEFTATGNFSVTFSASADSAGQILAITIPWTINVTESTTLSELYAPLNMSSTISESISLLEVWDTEQQKWVNQTKNIGTWTNQDKS